MLPSQWWALGMPSCVSRNSTRSGELNGKRWEYLWLHLREEISVDVNDPVEALEMIAHIDSCRAVKNNQDAVCNMLKLNSQGIWQPRRLIATTKRCYILSMKGDQSGHEVVDSIPLHEIESLTTEASSMTGPPISRVRTHTAGTLERVVSGSQLWSDASRPEESAVTEPRASQPGRILDCPEFATAFEIRTQLGGFNQGIKFCFCTGSKNSQHEWNTAIGALAAQARTTFQRNNRISNFQEWARKQYNHHIFQGVIVAAITANFLGTLAESETGSDGSNVCPNGTQPVNQSFQALQTQHDFERMDTAFTILFLAELLFNFSAHAFVPFFSNRWNWFDCVVVLTSVGFLFVSSSNNGLVKQLRILRVFRVLRAFGRIGQLREIVNAITQAIVPASQALLLGLIVVAIYSAIGTHYFDEENPAGFCDFFHAFYTMFSIIAYNAPDNLAPFDPNGVIRLGQLAFIYSYILIVLFVMLQVVVAVLLNSFERARQKERELNAIEDAASSREDSQSTYPLDPLLEQVAATYDTEVDLLRRFDSIFDAFDLDKTGALSFDELYAGLAKSHRAHLTHEQYEHITDSYKLCDRRRELQRPHFRRVMVLQLRLFTQRKLAESLFLSTIGGDRIALLTNMKLALIELDCLRHELASLHDDLARQDALERQLREQGRDMDLILLSVAHGRPPAPPHSASTRPDSLQQLPPLRRAPALPYEPPLAAQPVREGDSDALLAGWRPSQSGRGDGSIREGGGVPEGRVSSAPGPVHVWTDLAAPVSLTFTAGPRDFGPGGRDEVR